jgi:hypothetical protein
VIAILFPQAPPLQEVILQDDDQISIWTLFGAQVLSISVPVDTDLQSVNIQEIEAGSFVVKVSREGLTLFSTLFIKL